MQAIARCQHLQPVAAAGRARQQQQAQVGRQPAPPPATAAALPWARPAAAVQQCWGQGLAAAGMASLLLLGSPLPALAAGPPSDDPARCEIAALDKFADTRATFSQEASGGGMTEAIVDIRGCDFTNLNLSGKVLSGVLMQGSDFSGSKLVGSQFARATARGAVLKGTDLSDTNCFGTSFDGADLEDASFENALLSAASFGQYKGVWANLKGTHFEGALLSSSDVVRVCENPTLDEYTAQAELGCRKSRGAR